MDRTSSSLHVLIFPHQVQGHLNPMLKLAELLCLADLNITFINYEHIHKDLVNYTDVEARFSKYPGFQFITLPNCLPLGFPKSSDKNERFREIMKAYPSSKQELEKLCVESKPSFTCIIGDSVLAFVQDIAEDYKIPYVEFSTCSACFQLIYRSIHHIVEAGELPIKGEEDMDRLISKVPGMETFLRCRDLPSFHRVFDTTEPKNQMFLSKRKPCKSLILNTFEDLEAPILSQIRTHHSPKIYTIGPLHELLKVKLKSFENDPKLYSSSSNSLRKEDRSCISWLDTQPTKSVLYVSFGSLSRITTNQLMEFWHGIVNSKMPFLWVIRPDSVTNENGEVGEILEELKEGPKENGYIANWAPQEDVLAHEAIGGFLTHSGWNSTLESIVAGVPMICWPYYADQYVNSRLVSEVWKLGLDMKDLCDREIIEKMVHDLMINRREEFVKLSTKMAELARNRVQEGGSPSSCLDRLIQDIKLMNI